MLRAGGASRRVLLGVLIAVVAVFVLLFSVYPGWVGRPAQPSTPTIHSLTAATSSTLLNTSQAMVTATTYPSTTPSTSTTTHAATSSTTTTTATAHPVDTNPPEITSLNWTPTRVVLDKVYDIQVSFTAVDNESPIARAELRFKPVEYQYMMQAYGVEPEDYSKIFPPEGERSYNLTPVDGEFDGLEETFTVQITNITGGREYKIVILVEDSAGNTKTVEVKTPYIRQYENIGKVLYVKGVVLCANYFPYYPRPHPWELLEPMVVHPLLGKYDVVDPVVISKHIDWATGHGVNCFFMSWVPTWDGGSLQLLENIARFMDNPLSSNIMVAIQYEGIQDRLRRAGVKPDANGIYHVENSNQWETIVEDMKTLEKLFFTRNNYLKINGKPVVYFYASGSLSGNISGFVEDIKREVNIYMISDYAHPWAATSSFTINNTGGWIEECDERGNCFLINYAVNYDAWTTWAAGWYTPVVEPLEENYPKFLDEGYKVWSKLALKYSKTFVPSIIPGFINLRDPDFPKLPRKPEMFKAMVLTALEYSTTPAGEKIIKIDTYNEFGEATGIEPTREEGFAYLEVLRSILLNLTKDTSPPTITSLNWTPTRVILDKVYDINVSFTAIDDENPIAYAELRFVPVEYYYMVEKYGMRPEDYPKVFPPDKERVFVLTPIDGKFDSLKEEFSVQIRDIVGGREYKIVALIKDLAGNEKIVEVKTPYIRQFENIAKTDDIIVIADYYTWYEQITAQGSHWRGDKGEVAHSQYPLLGEYASSDPIVISKHIDWATGHGIDAFSISWWTTGNDERTWDYHSKENLDTLLRNPLIKGIEFCILYEDYGRLPVKRIIYDYDPNGNEFIPLDDPQNMQRLLEDFKFLADTYFSHPQYLKIDGKPVVQFDADRIWFGNIEEVISLLRGKIREEKGYEMYLISNVLGWYFPNAPYDVLEERNIQIVKSMDAISANGNMWLYSIEDARSDFPTFVKSLYERWYNFSRNYNSQTTLIPNLMPGEEINPYWVRDPAYVPLKRSPQLFEALIKIALKYVGTKTKIIKISAFNEWGYGLAIEPSQEENFAYLQILMNYLKR
ncbi:MAG: glycoside hydrolase family 99-like domain-containing protein [Desulfurococcaceae archaeon]